MEAERKADPKTDPSQNKPTPLQDIRPTPPTKLPLS